MITLHTLGAVDLRKGDVELSTVLAQPKRLALLVYLASARPRGYHSRDTLLALFWPESDAERARNSLRQALHQLRRALGEGALPGRGEREVAVDPALVRCDAADFDRAIEDECWEEAVELYRGDFLPGLFVHDAPEAERWIEDERLRRRRDAVDAAWRLAAAAERLDAPMEAARWARRAAALEPMDEGSLRRLLASLDRAGDTAGAIAAYDDFARRLEREYGAGPAAETAAIVTAIRGRGAQPKGDAVRAPGGDVGFGGGPPAAARAAIPPAVTVSAAVPSAAAMPSASSSAAAPPTPDAPAAAALAAIVPASAPVAAVPPPAARARPVHRRWLAAAAVVLLLATAAAGLYALRLRGTGAAAVRPEPTVAVLPFVNMSGDPANEFLSDGMTEELLNLLAQVPGLRVAARTSSFSFKNRNLPVDSIGRALRVRHILEGSIRQAGEGARQRVRITAQLIDAETGYHLWSGAFDTRVEDAFAVQDSIGRVIVETLRPRLAAGPAVHGREPRDPDAQTALVRGWQTFRRNSPEAYEAALAHFREALRRDPAYGRAVAGVATVRMWQGYLRLASPDSAYREADSLARRALALDSTAHDAHLVLARLAEFVSRNDSVADAHYARAMALAPSDPRAYGRRAVLLVRLGRREEALALARQGVELDPASPAVYADIANLYDDLGMIPEQERALRTALSLDPGHPILLQNLAGVLTRQRRFEEAGALTAEARRKAPRDPNLIGFHAYLEARLDHRARAMALADTAARLGASPVNLASVYALLGERDRAFALIDRAIRERDDRVVALLDTAVVHGLRDDPRMAGVMQRVRGMRR